jgi:hypothetical protein
MSLSLPFGFIYIVRIRASDDQKFFFYLVQKFRFLVGLREGIKSPKDGSSPARRRESPALQNMNSFFFHLWGTFLRLENGSEYGTVFVS